MRAGKDYIISGIMKKFVIYLVEKKGRNSAVISEFLKGETSRGKIYQTC